MRTENTLHPKHRKGDSFHRRKTLELNNAGDVLATDFAETKPAKAAGSGFKEYNASVRDELQVGQMVQIRDCQGMAWVMWSDGDMIGVELEGPWGDSDGVYRGERHFHTPPQCATFVATTRVDLLYDIQPAPRFHPSSHDINVGDVVMVSKAVGVGVVRYAITDIIGCELNAPVGDSNGSYKGIQHFQVAHNHATWIDPTNVKKIASEDLLHKLNETVLRLQQIEQDLSRSIRR